MCRTPTDRPAPPRLSSSGRAVVGRIDVPGPAPRTPTWPLGYAQASPAGSVLITDFQDAGRGRRGGSWVAPPGSGIALSVRSAPAIEPDCWTWLPLLAGLAVVEGLGRATHNGGRAAADLKWPNDLHVDGLKICGILAEQLRAPVGRSAWLGWASTSGCKPMSSRADRHLARSAGRRACAGACRGDRRRGPHPARRPCSRPGRARMGRTVRADYLARCTTIGRDIRVQLAAERSPYGLATGLDDDGCPDRANSQWPGDSGCR